MKEKSLIPFNRAPAWNQELAQAREELLRVVDKEVSVCKDEFGKTEAIKLLLDMFNKGLIYQDIRQRLKGKSVSCKSFYRWQKVYKKHGLSGLLARYKTGDGFRLSAEIRESIERHIWTDHLCYAQDVYDGLVVKHGKENLPSYSTVRRFVKQYKAENWPILVLEHEGKKGLRDRNMEVALGRADANLTAPNQRWELDTTVADLFTGRKIKDVVLKTKDGKRCKIIGVIDVFSRSVRFYMVERETALAVGQVIRDRVLKWGLPDEIVIDNGKPFKSERVLSFCLNLQVSVHICIPGNPVEKPHIERAFRTLSESLFRRLRGYSGNSVATRPNEIEIEYTKAQAQELMDNWCEFVYSETVHSSTGQRPRERMAWPGFIPKTLDPRELDVLLMIEKERVVRQGHIAFQGGKYFHRLLPEGQKVKVRWNDFDASELLVFMGGQYLCTAEDYSRTGKTPEEIREAKKARNQELRTRLKAHEALIGEPESKDALLLAEIESGRQSKPAELPKKAEVYSFPGLENAEFTRPGQGEAPEDDTAFTPEGTKLIKSREEMYFAIRAKEGRGEVIDAFEEDFLADFLTSNEYRWFGEMIEERRQEAGL